MKSASFEKTAMAMCLGFLGLLLISHPAKATDVMNALINPQGLKLQFIGLLCVYIAVKICKSSSQNF